MINQIECHKQGLEIITEDQMLDINEKKVDEQKLTIKNVFWDFFRHKK